MTERKPIENAVFKANLYSPEEEGGQYTVEVSQVLSTKPLQLATKLREDFGSEAEARQRYNAILDHPFPTTGGGKSDLAAAQDKVELPGKTDSKGNPKTYNVPDILKTFTRRDYRVELAGDFEDDDKKKLTACTANLVFMGGGEPQVVNSASAKAPWAALELLAVLTERWFSFAKTGQVKRPEIKRSEIPDGAILPKDGPKIIENKKAKAEKPAEEPAKAEAGTPKQKSGKPKGKGKTKGK